VNKADLIDNVAERLGHSKKDVTDIVDAFLLETKKAVAKGEKVAVAGFGVFESTARKARMGRNPRTGDAVKIKATKLPKFRPGADFKGVVSGDEKFVEPAAKKTTAKKSSKPAAKKR
jgi:DNA-binding protein HU-beta